MRSVTKEFDAQMVEFEKLVQAVAILEKRVAELEKVRPVETALAETGIVAPPVA